MSIKELSIKAEQEVNTSVEEAFYFHADINNLTKVVPPFIKLQIEKMDWPFEEGAHAELSLKLFGVLQILYWKLKLTEYNAPNFFVDEETGGIFESFKHKHEFIKIEGESNKCLLKDSLSYAPKGWMKVFYLIPFVPQVLLKVKLLITKSVLER
ncbi:MAG TPA: hypothetical protein V6C96_04600 [Vampirovibrionales bacterium]